MRRKKKGFTIIEMVAALAMISLIIAATSSLILFGIKQSTFNRKILDTNDASKSFFEMVKNNRAEYPEGTYCLYFDNLNDLKTSFNSFKDKNISGNIKLVSNTSNYENIKGSNTSSKKSAMKVNVTKNDIDKTYEFRTSSWNLDKGELTQVDREYILAQGK